LIFIAAHCSCKPNLPHPTNHFARYYTATSSPPESFILDHNDPSKPWLTSKPSLTIALKILKTIEKPLTPMVGPSKKHSMVMVQRCQNHPKTIELNGGLNKKH